MCHKHKDSGSLRVRRDRKICHANTNQKNTELNVLILLYFKTWKITKDRETLHTNKEVSSLRRHNNPKCLCT